MEYRVCQGVDFKQWEVSCRGGMAGYCWPYETSEEREVCGEWRTSQNDAYASFYSVLNSVTNCDAPGTSCSGATPLGEPRLRTNESGATKLIGADEKSVGDSILGVINMILSSFRING